MNYPGIDPRCAFQPEGYWPGAGPAPFGARQVGLWAFIGVVCALFGLFAAAYLMRITYDDWRVLPPVPWQLWLSTALLVAGDVAWPLAAASARRHRHALAMRLGVLGWLLALAFLGSQVAAWQAMAAQRIVVISGPAAGFFYMLTALHGVHVLGGIVAAGWMLGPAGARRAAASPAELQFASERRLAEGFSLCARYWHLLLALWLGLFALLFWMTPELVREMCASIGIPLRPGR